MTTIQIIAIIVIFIVGGGGALLPLVMQTRVSPHHDVEGQRLRGRRPAGGGSHPPARRFGRRLRGDLTPISTIRSPTRSRPRAFLLVLAVERVVPTSRIRWKWVSTGDPEADAFVDADVRIHRDALSASGRRFPSIRSSPAWRLGTDEAAVVLSGAADRDPRPQGFRGLRPRNHLSESPASPFRRALPALLFFACSTSTGVVLGLFADLAFDAGSMHVVTAWFKAIAAGTFLYIAALDIVREEFFPVETDRHGRYVCAFIGAGVMALVAIWM